MDRWKTGPGANRKLRINGVVQKFFSASGDLQDYLLRDAGPGTLTVVPHQRLAHQIWHRQRLGALQAGRTVWEPLALSTLQAWWTELFQGLWPQAALAPPLLRLALWRQALKAAPLPNGSTSELSWAQALDETHILMCRHGLPVFFVREPGQDDSPLVAWRRHVTHIYSDLLRQENWLSPGELPAYLMAALRAGKLKLPGRVLVACLETPAPLEELWLREVSRRVQVEHLQVRGDQNNIQEAVSLPDPQQELHWVAAQLVELAQGGVPLHRLAVTAMDMDTTYTPQLRRILAEVLGPPEAEGGWAYNFSRGPSLSETPLFLAGLLPLEFLAGRERREDLVSMLLSPYYGKLRIHGRPLARWDQLFREHRCDQGWDRLRKTVARSRDGEGEAGVLMLLDRGWNFLNMPTAPAKEWCLQLNAAWQELGFPRGLNSVDTEAWARLTDLLGQVGSALNSEVIAASEFLEWLKIGARRVILPGPGIQTAGIQVLGLLELRGLDFSRVFCLGMNSGVLPAPPRSLPLLSVPEKRQVLGGTYQSQHHFAAELFANLLGAASHLTFTRPKLVEQEERVSTPLYPGEWSETKMAILSVPHPAWLRSKAVRAVFGAARSPLWPGYADHLLSLAMPSQISLSQISTALGCPCRFLLEHVLKVRELPEIEAGMDPRERGQLLHEVLALFASEFREVLEQERVWDHERAQGLLREAVQKVLAPLSFDLHWQAEADRWLGESGLLWEWLRLERERFEAGWRWLDTEVVFQGLHCQDWPFTLKGRIDRLDYHSENADLVVWDYKSGEIPQKQKVLEDQEEPQLPCYLLAVEQGHVPVNPSAAGLRAGFIGLKSPRSHHLKHEDFNATPEKWQAAALAFAERVGALGRLLAAGDFHPDPNPAPAGKSLGVCQYCLYSLICGFIPVTTSDDEEEEL
jgi:RecB family exonuclease